MTTTCGSLHSPSGHGTVSQLAWRKRVKVEDTHDHCIFAPLETLGTYTPKLSITFS